MLRVFFSLFLIIPWLSFAGVSLSEQRIIYQGEISAKNNQHVAQLLAEQPSINSIQITSGGGNVDLGMDLAELILAHNLKVHIQQFCFSSCANYVLLAGNPTTIAKNAIVGWHGDAASARWRDSDIDAMVSHLKEPEKTTKWQALRTHYDEIIAKAVAREKAFYAKRGVKHDLLTIGLSEELKRAAVAQKARGWSYSKQALNTLNVSNIEFADWQPRSAKNFPLLIINELGD
ncbi:hypothetical protein A3733_10240 [Pseudoalteromonas shioyasakiensis]|nr:hypothetical protein A3733_10240 [Pseudoalteromonas shioyasakiensis]